MNIYGKAVVEALKDGPLTANELGVATGFRRDFVFQGIWNARAEHLIFAEGHNDAPTTYRHLLPPEEPRADND